MGSVLLLLVVACWDSSDGDSTLSNNSHLVDDTGTITCNDVITWDSWAHGFFLNNCTSCHSSALHTEDERQKAPLDINLDTYAGVTADRVPEAILVYATGPDASMPPNIRTSDEDRQTLRLWIECGLKEH
jgi:hypothetical protein